MTNAKTNTDVAYVRLDRNALTFAESYAILRQSRQLHLLPFKWTRLLSGKLLRIQALGVHPAPRKMQLSPLDDAELSRVSTKYPQLSHIAKTMTAARFGPAQLMKNADPRNEFPNYMLFSIDPAAVVGVSSVVMDVGCQIAAWTDMVSVREDSTMLFSSTHPDSGKLRPRPGAIHQRIVGADFESLYNCHRETIAKWPDTKRLSVDDVVDQVCSHYEKQIDHWLECGLYVLESGRE